MSDLKLKNLTPEELERDAREEYEAAQAEMGLKPQKPVRYENLPNGSMQHLADQLHKSQRQIRRWCEQGLIPGAFRTQKGHWRIRYHPGLIKQVKSKTEGKTRERQIPNPTRLRRRLQRQELPPDADDLIFGKLAYAVGPDAHNLSLEMILLRNEGLAVTVTALANAMQCSRSSIYRKFGQKRLKAMIIAFTVSGNATEYPKYFQELGKNLQPAKH